MISILCIRLYFHHTVQSNGLLRTWRYVMRYGHRMAIHDYRRGERCAHVACSYGISGETKYTKAFKVSSPNLYRADVVTSRVRIIGPSSCRHCNQRPWKRTPLKRTPLFYTCTVVIATTFLVTRLVTQCCPHRECSHGILLYILTPGWKHHDV